MINLENIGAAAFVVVKCRDGQFVLEDFNAAGERLTGLQRATAIGRSLIDLFPRPVSTQLVASYETCLQKQQVVEFKRVMPGLADKLTIRTTLTPLVGKQGEQEQRILAISVDITEQNQLQEKLRTANARLAIAMEAIGGGHWFYDSEAELFEFSHALQRMLGFDESNTMKMDEWLKHVHPEDRDDTCFADLLSGRIEQGQAEFRVCTDDGNVRWLRCRRQAVRKGRELAGIAGIVVDVTQDKRREAALSHQATSDPLTGLANRRRFEEIFAAERERTAEAGTSLALLMIDVDRFKLYNDTHGHVAGDTVLKRVAHCLQGAVHDRNGTVARYGGEEFVIVLPGLDTDAAGDVAETILTSLRQMAEPHRASPTGLVSVSIGVTATAYPRSRAASDLVAIADAALYRAKNDGRGCFRVMTAEMAQSRHVDAA